MTEDREDRIRERAYALWEQAGRPPDTAREHWAEAAREVDAALARDQADEPPAEEAGDVGGDAADAAQAQDLARQRQAQAAAAAPKRRAARGLFGGKGRSG